MKKILLSTMGAIAIAFGGMAMAPSAAQAGIAVGEDGNLVIFGDARFRAEYDDRDNVGGGNAQDRDRLRVRARFGALYTVNDNWSMGLRFATSKGKTQLNSPYQTFGFFNKSGDNAAFGLDRAYVKYRNEGFSIWAGENNMNFWMQNEVWWDEDLPVDGIGATYKFDPVTLNLGYFIISEGNWQVTPTSKEDSAFLTYQGVYSAKLNALDGIKLTAAAGGGSFTGDKTLGLKDVTGLLPGVALQSDTIWTASLQVKGSNWRVGADYFKGNAATESTAYVVQGRYKISGIGNGIGLRLYYYDIGAYSVPGDGIFTQDNWANPGNFGVSNFTGFRYQIDYKFNNKTSLDLRYYDAKVKTAGLLSQGNTITDAIMSKGKHSRAQLNVTVKF